MLFVKELGENYGNYMTAGYDKDKITRIYMLVWAGQWKEWWDRRILLNHSSDVK